MSNRFNRPDMLKANRQRNGSLRAHRAALIEARRFVETREEARCIEEARKIGKHLPAGSVVRYRRDTRPWHEKFVEWVTGC